MKSNLILLSFLIAGSAALGVAAPAGDYTERFDTLYNSLTLQRTGSIVEMRARARSSEALESAIDLSNPLRLVVAYTKTLYAGLFFLPEPKRVLVVGLGGAGFHRPFAEVFPDALLQTVELDPKVFELCQSHMGFNPTDRTPVALMDGRMFVKRDKQKWDWLILDAFRGGFVPPHLKTEEFYRECAARLSERGVFIANLHATSRLYVSDLRTIQKVFPQLVLFHTPGSGNVIACAVNYSAPSITNQSAWPAVAKLNERMRGLVDLGEVQRGRFAVPPEATEAPVLTDDFAPVEFLDAIKSNNTERR